MNQRIAVESRILRQVRHDHYARLQDGMTTDRNVERQFVLADADFRLEPLPVIGHEIDDRHWRIEDVGRHLRNIVEHQLASGIKNAIALERGRTRRVAVIPGTWGWPIARIAIVHSLLVVRSRGHVNVPQWGLPPPF